MLDTGVNRVVNLVRSRVKSEVDGRGNHNRGEGDACSRRAGEEEEHARRWLEVSEEWWESKRGDPTVDEVVSRNGQSISS